MRSSVSLVLVVLGLFLMGLSEVSFAQSRQPEIDEIVLKWQAMQKRIDDIKVIRRKNFKVIHRKTPFEIVETIEITTLGGRLPIRGFAFDLKKARVVIIQNLFGTAGAELSDSGEVQFKEMLRSLLPRQSLVRAFEIEVRGFTDIQNFGNPLDLTNCKVEAPRNNACLGKARAFNTSAIIKSYLLTTLGAEIPLIQKYDPDPVMHNLNLLSEGKVWQATGAEANALEIARMFAFRDALTTKLDIDTIVRIRNKASKKIGRGQRRISELLQPFRCAIVIAWRS